MEIIGHGFFGPGVGNYYIVLLACVFLCGVVCPSNRRVMQNFNFPKNLKEKFIKTIFGNQLDQIIIFLK